MLMVNLKTSLQVDCLQEEKIKEQIFRMVQLCFGERELQTIFCLEDGAKITFPGAKGSGVAVMQINSHEQLMGMDCEKFAARMSEVMEKELGIVKNDFFVLVEQNILWTKNGSYQAHSSNYVPFNNGKFLKRN